MKVINLEKYSGLSLFIERGVSITNNNMSKIRRQNFNEGQPYYAHSRITLKYQICEI